MTHTGIVAAGDQWHMSDKIEPYQVWIRTLLETSFKAGYSDILLQWAISCATVSATRNLYTKYITCSDVWDWIIFIIIDNNNVMGWKEPGLVYSHCYTEAVICNKLHAAHCCMLQRLFTPLNDTCFLIQQNLGSDVTDRIFYCNSICGDCSCRDTQWQTPKTVKWENFLFWEETKMSLLQICLLTVIPYLKLSRDVRMQSEFCYNFCWFIQKIQIIMALICHMYIFKVKYSMQHPLTLSFGMFWNMWHVVDVLHLATVTHHMLMVVCCYLTVIGL